MLTYEQRKDMQDRAAARLAAFSQKRESARYANLTDAEKIGATFEDVFGNVLSGALKGLEGIYDAGATIVGAVGGLFDKQYQENIKKEVAFDWTADIYGNELLERTKDSYINKMGSFGQEMVRGTASGVGQMLPALATNLLLPGSGLVTIGVSAAGSGTEKAFKDGSTYGQGMAYGVMTGLVEVVTEKLWGSGLENVTGKGLLDGVLKSTAKTALWKTALKNFGQEAVEEALATFVEPALRSIYQKDAYKETFTPEQLTQVLKDGFVGGLTSLVYGNTIGKIKTTKMNVGETVGEIRSNELKKTKLWESGLLTEDAENKLGANIEVATGDLNKKLAKLSENKRADMIKKFGIVTNEDGTVKQYQRDSQYNSKSYSPSLYGKEETLKYKPTATPLSDQMSSAVKTVARLNKTLKTPISTVVADDLGSYNGKMIQSQYDPTTGVLTLAQNAEKPGQEILKGLAVHEVTHAVEGTKDYAKFQAFVLGNLGKDEDLISIMDSYVGKQEGTAQERFDSLTKKQKYVVVTELTSKYSEKLFTDEKVIERLTRENRTLAQKVWNWLKDTISFYQTRKTLTDDEKTSLDFLRKAESLYKKALESSEGGVVISEIDEVKQAEPDDTRKSLDSTGTTLTPEQAEFFKDSKARDENGNLLIMYHGTNAEFTVFETTSNKSLGGFMFTDNKTYADTFAKDRAFKGTPDTKETYLNLQNPMVIDLNDSVALDEQIRVDKELRKNAKITGDIFWNYVKKTAHEKNDGIIIKNIKPNYTSQTWAVAFSPNQIKLTTNLAPTSDEDIRYSIADDKKKTYTAVETRERLTQLLAERLQFGYKFGELSKMSEVELVEMYLNKMDESDNLEKAAEELADFIVENATIDNGEIDTATAENLWYLDTLAYYHGKIDLSGIGADIKSHYGNSAPYAIWGKRKGNNSGTPDVVAMELEDAGIHIDAINPADIFFQIDDMWKTYNDKVNKQNKERKETVKSSLYGENLDALKLKLKADIIKIVNESGKTLTDAEMVKNKQAKINKLKKQMEALKAQIESVKADNSATQTVKDAKIQELNEELVAQRHDIDNLYLEKKDDTARIQRFADMLKVTRKEVGMMAEQLRDAKLRAKYTDYLFERVERVKGLQQYVGSGMELAEPIVALIKLLKKVKTWRGNLSTSIRDIMKVYANPHDGIKLYDILAREEPGQNEKSQNPVAELIEEIAQGNGDLSTDEIISMSKILDNFVHNVREYDKVFFEGRSQTDSDIISQGIAETQKAVPMKEGPWKKFQNWLEAPIWRFTRLSNYDDGGVMSRIFWEMQNGLSKQEQFNMDVSKHFEKWFKENSKFAETWHEKTTINGIEISKGQAMSLFMLSLREQAKKHLWNRTETIVEPNKITVVLKGTIRIVDDKIAMTDVTEAQEKGKNVEIDESFIDAIKKQFTEQEKDFMRLSWKFFDVMSANAKKETDLALYGIAEELSDHYFPIRSAKDQVYSRMGDTRTAGAQLFSIYTASFNKKVNEFANNNIVVENILDVLNRHTKQMASYVGMAIPIKAFNRIWNNKTLVGTLKAAVGKVDTSFESYIAKLFKDIQGSYAPYDSFDKFVSKIRGWGARAALGLNPKVWTTQIVSLFAAHGVGFKYETLLKGVTTSLAGKTDFDKLAKYSPMMFARFRDGSNIDVGRLQESGGTFGKLDKFTEWTTKPIGYMDKMVIGAIWNAALETAQGEGEEKFKNAAKMVEKAVIVTQSNYTPLFRPEILRSRSTLLQLSTMFMSEPLQVFSQIFGAVDKLRVAKQLTADAVTPEETKKAKELTANAKKYAANALTSVTVDMILLAMIAQAFKWVKGKDDEEEFAVGFGKEMLSNIIGMFPFIRDVYSVMQGYDITNMAYTGLTQIGYAAVEIGQAFTSITTGDAVDSVDIMGGIKKVFIGVSQTFGIPARNLETYMKGITEKFAPGAVETYDSWFYKKTNAYYQVLLDDAISRGKDGLADTIIGLMMKDTTSKVIKDEIGRLYALGLDAMPQIAKTSITFNSEVIELTNKEYKQFLATYSKAEPDAEKMTATKPYVLASDEVKSDSLKLVYDYYYNLAKGDLVGEDTTGTLGVLAESIPVSELAVIVASAKGLAADKDELGKSITGSKKAKVSQLLAKSGLGINQQNLILAYLGYSVEETESFMAYLKGLDLTTAQKELLAKMLT